jgi:cell division protein FtsB
MLFNELKPTIITTAIGLLSTAISALGGYLWTRRERNREVISQMNESFEHLSEKYMEMSANIIDLYDRLIRLEQENQQFKRENAELKQQIIKLKNCQENG